VGTGIRRTQISAAARGEDGSTTSQPKSVSITPTLNATVPPVDPGPFGRRLKAHGINARSGRNTALISLAADLPAPVLAGLLGLHVQTGVRWTKYAKRDWESYLADRRTAHRGV
jgi:hypothetical protein